MSNPISLKLSEPQASALRLILDLQARELADAIILANLACDGRATRTLAGILDACNALRAIVASALDLAVEERAAAAVSAIVAMAIDVPTESN